MTASVKMYSDEGGDDDTGSRVYVSIIISIMVS